MNHLSLFLCLVALIAGFTAQGVAALPADQVILHFSATTNYNSSFTAVAEGFRTYMSWPSATQYHINTYGDCNEPLCLYYYCDDATMMTQLTDRIEAANGVNNLRDYFASNTNIVGHVVISSVTIVDIPTATPAPTEEKSFVAKYPYVIAGIAVACLIGIIVAAVALIQKRANHLAEMDDESMLAENAVPGWRSGANEAVGGSNNGGGASRGGAGRGRGGGRGRGRGSGAAYKPKTADNEDTDAGEQKGTSYTPAAVPAPGTEVEKTEDASANNDEANNGTASVMMTDE